MFTAAFAALALFASPEAAQSGGQSGAAPEAPAAAPAQPAAKPKKVCQKMPEVSGSRLAKKVCVTEKPKAEASPEGAGAGKPAL